MNIPDKLGIIESDFRLVFGGSSIDYDFTKEGRNRKKHGYSLESAVYILERALLPVTSPPIITSDPFEVKGEIRHMHMGVDDENNIVFIVTTMRKSETIRVISFRKAHEKERQLFLEITGYKSK